MAGNARPCRGKEGSPVEVWEGVQPTVLLGTWGTSPVFLNCKDIFFCGFIFEKRSPVSKVGLQCYVWLGMTVNS